MTTIKFTRTEIVTITQRIQNYFSDELKQEIGRFDAEFLLDFFSREIGPHFYNKGLLDAQTLLASKLDELSYSISELEKPIDFTHIKK